jgi:predicted esterase
MTEVIHETQPALMVGATIDKATSVMILLHGRGSSAEDIIGLARALPREGMAYIAPQAADHTWYPYRFIEPIHVNEPYLSSALATIGGLVEQLNTHGIPSNKIVLAGFSQGACLASEFAARRGGRWGGLLVFSGGLIGQAVNAARYPNALAETPVFIGCDSRDFHIPLARVQETTAQLRAQGAVVTERIYDNMGHTINDDEIAEAHKIVANLG